MLGHEPPQVRQFEEWREFNYGNNKDPDEQPTCSLNLLCFSRGYSMSQIRVTTRAKFDTKDAYDSFMADFPRTISTDEQLFRELRSIYHKEFCGFWRVYFSLKTLSRLRLLEYTERTGPTLVPMDDFSMQEVLYVYNHPSESGTGTEWIEWVFCLRNPNRRHALEFVEGWNWTRIAVVGSIPCIVSMLVGVIWSVRGGDTQMAFTVAGFVLTTATVLLALLAIIGGTNYKAQ